MLSIKMLLPVGVLIPIYLLFRDFGLLDTRTGLVIVLTLFNLSGIASTILLNIILA